MKFLSIITTMVFCMSIIISVLALERKKVEARTEARRNRKEDRSGEVRKEDLRKRLEEIEEEIESRIEERNEARKERLQRRLARNQRKLPDIYDILDVTSSRNRRKSSEFKGPSEFSSYPLVNRKPQASRDLSQPLFTRSQSPRKSSWDLKEEAQIYSNDPLDNSKLINLPNLRKLEGDLPEPLSDSFDILKSVSNKRIIGLGSLYHVIKHVTLSFSEISNKGRN